MSSYAQKERLALCDLFDDLGPEAPTLCAGWNTRLLAAHLLVRERRPDVAPGLVFGGLAARHTAKVTARTAESMPFDRLVGRIRSGPPALLQPINDLVNLVEFFVHHEDVRRANEGWEQRLDSEDLQETLWRYQRSRFRMQTSRVQGVDLSVSRPGDQKITVRRVQKGGLKRPVGVTGEPGELALFFFGRSDHAVVEVTGDPAGIEEVRSAVVGL